MIWLNLDFTNKEGRKNIVVKNGDIAAFISAYMVKSGLF